MSVEKEYPRPVELPFSTSDFNGMPYRMIGNSGLRASNVGLGTWKYGYSEKGDGSRVDEKTAFAIFDRAIELGVTFWDTANRYNFGSGNSERIIGKWFKNHPEQRRNVVLATKIYGNVDGITPNHSRLSRQNILDSVYACLNRLQTSHIDLLYFHTLGDLSTPIEESLAAIEDLVERDMIRYFGIGNATPGQIEEYQDMEKQFSVRVRVIAVQNHYDLLAGDPAETNGALEYCARTKVSLVAWSPLCRGLITERYLDLSKVGRGDRLFDEGTLQKDATPKTMEKIHRLADLAHAWGYEVNQLTLAYMLTLPGMGPVIPASSTVTQLESNARAGKIELSGDQIQQIRSALLG